MEPKTAQPNGFDEAARYYLNARELLDRCRVQDGIYADLKPVQEAFGTAWLAVDKALKAALRGAGIPARKMPRSWDSLRDAAVRRLAVRNGKLVRLLNAAYEMIHLEGYYHGAYQTPEAARSAFDVARRAIEKLSSQRVP